MLDYSINALALDLDGTIRPREGAIERELLRQLVSLRERGAKLVLVTGRCLPELQDLVDISLFDAMVLENGAIVLLGNRRINLAPPEWDPVRRQLRRLFKAGREEVIISLGRSKENAVKPYVGEGARLEFNKNRLMILPNTIDKGSGLQAALGELKMNASRLMCIGDGENDLAMFRIAHLKVAVRDSAQILKEEADYVTEGKDGKGASEAIKRFIVSGMNVVDPESSSIRRHKSAGTKRRLVHSG